ncbi:MAG: glucose 1-dehydrogenase [Pseudomonadota bacterium]|nr:glucose 1-dehydrogenase [Pseudomonadota bacterium]
MAAAGDIGASFRHDGKVAVVTGGSQGIGRATSLAFSAAGARIVIVDRDGEAAAACAGEMRDAGAPAVALTADVAEEAEVEAAFTDILRREGRIDILVNNAGTAIRKPAVDLPLADWDKVVAVNMTGVFLCSRAAARRMIAAGNGGAIVNVASIMGLSGGGLYPNISYQTTKGAVVNMTRALAVEWAPHGIRVNAVAPTYVRTEFIAPILAHPDLVERIEAMTPLRRLAEPEEVAAAILFLASPAAAMITGHTLPVDGGFLAQ